MTLSAEAVVRRSAQYQDFITKDWQSGDIAALARPFHGGNGAGDLTGHDSYLQLHSWNAVNKRRVSRIWPLEVFPEVIAV